MLQFVLGPPTILLDYTFAQNTLTVLEQKFENNVYPCKPQFYHIKVGCKGVYISRTCFHDDIQIQSILWCGHYVNTTMTYITIFTTVKADNCQMTQSIIIVFSYFLISRVLIVYV